jgi:hypothetical protein
MTVPAGYTLHGSLFVYPAPSGNGLIIQGQNDISTNFHFCLDDTPTIQAIINAYPSVGVLRLVNICLQTKLDFTPWAGNNNVLELEGQNRCAMNKAELDIGSYMAVVGIGGGSGGGAVPIVEGQASFGSSNSKNPSDGSPEPNNLVTNAFVDSVTYKCFEFHINQAPSLDASGLVGQVMTISSVMDPTWNGTYCVIASYGAITRVVPKVASPTTPTTATDMHWSIGNRSGTTGDNHSADGGPINCLAVNNCKNLTSGSDKHWMSLTNASNFWLSNQLFRVMGIALDGSSNPTIAFINATTVLLKGGLTLPDYGSGGSIGTPKITAYEATPTIRMSGFACTLKNLSFNYSVGPGVCIDGGRGQTSYQLIDGCCSGGSGSFGAVPACVPLILSDTFFVTVRNCSFAAQSTNQNACILVTSTFGEDGGYSGVTLFDNITLNGTGVVLMSEGTTLPPSYIQFKNVNVDQISGNYSGQSWFSLFTFDCNNANDIYIEYPIIADAAGYLCESTFTRCPVNIRTNTALVGASGMGPNMANGGASITNVSGPVSELNARDWSMVGYQGVSDLQELGKGDDFSPVLSLPFQCPLPDLRTVAAWQALSATGSPTFSNLSGDGYPLMGPDGSSGKMIRISGYPGFASTPAFNVASPAIGDVCIVFMRCQSANPLFPLGFDGAGGVGVASIGFPTRSLLFNNKNATSFDVFHQNVVDQIYGGRWLDCAAYGQVTGFIYGSPGDPTSVHVQFGAFQAADTIIDPESIAMLYVPATTHPTLAPSEIVRYYRKLRRQVTSVPAGDVGLPTRMGQSWGGDVRMAPARVTTPNNSATTIYSYTVASNSAFHMSGVWTAIQPANVAAVSTGAFAFGGQAIANGVVTVSLVANVGEQYQWGTAANSNPISVATANNLVKIQVTAQSNVANTNWSMFVTQVNGR